MSNLNSNNNNSVNNNASSINNKSCKRTTGQNFNKLAANSVKKVVFNDCKKVDPSKMKFVSEKNYQDSFKSIIDFEKKITPAKKKDINVVIFHDENNDGIIAAYYAWRFLVNDNKKPVEFIGMKPSHGQNVDYRLKKYESQLRDSNILILDISYGGATLDYINGLAKSIIIIDDHSYSQTQNRANSANKKKNMFIGDGKHAAVSYTFKFFYPKEKVPKIAQYIDNSDAKLFLPFTPFGNLLTSSLGFRYSHQKIKKDAAFFEGLHQLLKDDNVNYFIFLGKYFEEVKENLKNQIAINARTAGFSGGYKVAVLNFNAPSLSKPVGRQMITNFKNMGQNIDFAVLWGYEYSTTPPAFRVQIIDDHVQTRLNMHDIAVKMAKIGGHPKGGGGHAHVGNFYWGRPIEELITTFRQTT